MTLSSQPGALTEAQNGLHAHLQAVIEALVEVAAQRAASLVIAQLANNDVILSEREPLLTVAEVAEFASVSRGSVYDAVASGKLAHSRVGRSIRIARADLTAWLDWRG